MLALVTLAACTVAPQKGEPEKQTVNFLMAPVNSITAQELGDQLHIADAQVLKTLNMAICAYSSKVTPQLAVLSQCVDEASSVH